MDIQRYNVPKYGTPFRRQNIKKVTRCRITFLAIHHKKCRAGKPVEQFILQLLTKRQFTHGAGHALQPGHGIVFGNGVRHVAGAHHRVAVHLGVKLRAAEELRQKKALLFLDEVLVGFEKPGYELMPEYLVVKFIGELPERGVTANALV